MKKILIFSSLIGLSVLLIFAGKSEAPEKLLLKDNSLVASVIIWLTLVIWILYGGLSV